MINPDVQIDHRLGFLHTFQVTREATYGSRLTTSSTERAEFLSLNVDKRAMKIAVFSVEIFPWIFLPSIVPIGFSSVLLQNRKSHELGSIECIVSLAVGVLALPLVPLFLPLTLPLGVIWAIGRAIRYRATRTTVEISGKKYYVKAKTYRQELQKLFHLDPENRPHSKKIYKKFTTDQQIFDLWRNLVTTSPERVGYHLMKNHQRYAQKTLYPRDRIGSRDYLLKELINSGVAPQRLLYIRTDEGYEFGSIFAHLNKRLHNQNPINEKEAEILEQWAHFLPEDAKSTCVLTLEVATARDLKENEQVNLFDVISNLIGKTQDETKQLVANRLVNEEWVPLFVSNYKANHIPLFQRGAIAKSANNI